MANGDSVRLAIRRRCFGVLPVVDIRNTSRDGTDPRTWPVSLSVDQWRTLGLRSRSAECAGMWDGGAVIPWLTDQVGHVQKDILQPLPRQLLLRWNFRWHEDLCSRRKWITSGRFAGGCGSDGWNCCCCWIGGSFRARSGGHCAQVICWLAGVLVCGGAGICSRGAPLCVVP